MNSKATEEDNNCNVDGASSQEQSTTCPLCSEGYNELSEFERHLTQLHNVVDSDVIQQLRVQSHFSQGEGIKHLDVFIWFFNFP